MTGKGKAVVTRIRAAMRSKRGHNVLVFAVFLLISALLWCVIAFNDETQSDVRMPVKITHVPDSVTIVSDVPDFMSVSLKARGTQLLKLAWGNVPSFNIDFRVYNAHKLLKLSDTDLKAIARGALDGAEISVVSPDSLRLAYTSEPPVRLPVNADYVATPGPQASIVGKVRLSVDSVDVYTIGRLSASVEAIATEPVRLSGLEETTTRRVKLIAPRNSRVIPDSVDLTIEVEPLIFKTRKVQVEPRNVPVGVRLITFPAQIEVMYMIPVSQYKVSEPHIKVVADYRSIETNPGARTVKLSIVEASENLQNVHLAADSAEFIIERL